MDVAAVAILIPIVSIIGGIAIVVVSIMSKARLRELEIKERIAMIERGMVPAPEADPRGFDRAIRVLDRTERNRGSARHRRAGITLMGVGFGLMVLIGFSSENVGSAIGVGGFLVVLGLAFFINALFETRQPDATSVNTGQPAPTGPPAPPASLNKD